MMGRKRISDFVVNYEIMHIAVCRIDARLEKTDHDYRPTISSTLRFQRLCNNSNFKKYRFLGNKNIWRFQVQS